MSGIALGERVRLYQWTGQRRCRCELNVFPAWYFAQDALSIAKIQVKPHCHAEFS